MPSYTITFIPYSDMSVDSGNPLSTSSTTGASGSFSVGAGATPITITVTDDDVEFDDAYIDPGASQILEQDVTVNGQTYLASDNPVVELEYSVDVSSGETFLVVRIDGVNVGMAGEVLPQAGASYTITGADDGQDTPYGQLACFTAGTRVFTQTGPRAVETLVPGDLVMTRDSGIQVLRWLGRRRVSLAEMRKDPDLRPVRITAGALDNEGDVVVSPQHRILVQDWRTQLYFAMSEALVAAKALVNGDTVTQAMPDAPVEYVHLAFDRHELLCTEGMWSESFDVWAQTSNMGDSEVRRELLKIFPELADGECRNPSPYQVLRMRQARILA